MLIGSVRKLVLLRLLIAMSVAPGLPAGATAEIQPTKSSGLSNDRLVVMHGISFVIPDGVGFRFSTNMVSHEQLLTLIAPPDRLDVRLQDVQGRKITALVLEPRTDVDVGGRLGYGPFLKSPRQESVAGYQVYRMNIAESLYVSGDGSMPNYFVCDNERVGVMAGFPRFCNIRESFQCHNGDGHLTFSLHYLVNFPDVPMLSGIDRNIRLFLTSLVKA